MVVTGESDSTVAAAEDGQHLACQIWQSSALFHLAGEEVVVDDCVFLNKQE